jgi:hypothetical protein
MCSLILSFIYTHLTHALGILRGTASMLWDFLKKQHQLVQFMCFLRAIDVELE